MEALHEIKMWLQRQTNESHVRPLKENQTTGQRVVFLGKHPANKFAVAEKLAAETGKELIRIDLSQAVSKYIGETEKNLRAIFEKAEGKDAILFFDEADALFGKRTGVKDSHDRYANQEVSYLLQKIESYSSLVIISSNRKENIDSPFLRRIRRVVEFD